MIANEGKRLSTPHPEKGSALVMVIFIIVVLALLLAALAYINAQSNQNTAYQIASTRAYWAAQSGAEWGAYQIAPATGSAASQCFSPNPAYPDIGSIPGLAGCSATVACSSSTTASVTSYRISSQGTCPAGNSGVANGALSATRSVIVGITASANSIPGRCATCIANNCSIFDYIFYILFGYLGPCAQQNCAVQCGLAPSSGAQFQYWLESP